jgi:hypothetical protein
LEVGVIVFALSSQHTDAFTTEAVRILHCDGVNGNGVEIETGDASDKAIPASLERLHLDGSRLAGAPGSAGCPVDVAATPKQLTRC